MKFTIEDDDGVVLAVGTLDRDCVFRVRGICGSSDVENWVETLTIKRKTYVSDKDFRPEGQAFALVNWGRRNERIKQQ